MTEPEYAVDDSGLLVPPRFDAGTAGDGRAPAVAAAQPPRTAAVRASAVGYSPTALTRPGVPTHRPASATAPLPTAGKLNWIFGVLGIATGLASFVWPLLCLTVLVSLALSAIGISRANRLRRRGANGRAVAIVGLVIGLASAANLVFGISQMLQLGSFVTHLLP
ncbi:hypothetical protein ACFOYW_00855 [Gryllotalpicola reticulitermitis]|uniref:DUF4190 domain-containing protein n=1 Tax=Gryllotalpicola reticulitermitis TaxID=1184153 RepID=A0ABV8Q0L1_9MICO